MAVLLSGEMTNDKIPNDERMTNIDARMVSKKSSSSSAGMQIRNAVKPAVTNQPMAIVRRFLKAL